MRKGPYDYHDINVFHIAYCPMCHHVYILLSPVISHFGDMPFMFSSSRIAFSPVAHQHIWKLLLYCNAYTFHCNMATVKSGASIHIYTYFSLDGHLFFCREQACMFVFLCPLFYLEAACSCLWVTYMRSRCIAFCMLFISLFTVALYF